MTDIGTVLEDGEKVREEPTDSIDGLADAIACFYEMTDNSRENGEDIRRKK